MSQDSSVGPATDYGLQGPGIESRCERDVPHPSRTAVGTTQSPYNGYRVFLWGKSAGCGVDPPNYIAPRLKKVQSYTSTPPWGFRDLFEGERYLKVELAALL
jgi:hypothetical protein